MPVPEYYTVGIKSSLEIIAACTISMTRNNKTKGETDMFKPLHNYVLLERIEEENKTAGGIIIPDNAKEKPSRGRVIAVGDGAYDGDDRIPMSVAVGNVVLFAKWASSANEVKIDGKDYVLIKETDILGILE